MTFDEFAAAAKQLEHITDCTIEACSYGVQIITEAYIANDDGSCIERGRGLVLLTMDQGLSPLARGNPNHPACCTGR